MEDSEPGRPEIQEDQGEPQLDEAGQLREELDAIRRTARIKTALLFASIGVIGVVSWLGFKTQDVVRNMARTIRAMEDVVKSLSRSNDIYRKNAESWKTQIETVTAALELANASSKQAADALRGCSAQNDELTGEVGRAARFVKAAQHDTKECSARYDGLRAEHDRAAQWIPDTPREMARHLQDKRELTDEEYEILVGLLESEDRVVQMILDAHPAIAHEKKTHLRRNILRTALADFEQMLQGKFLAVRQYDASVPWDKVTIGSDVDRASSTGEWNERTYATVYFGGKKTPIWMDLKFRYPHTGHLMYGGQTIMYFQLEVQNVAAADGSKAEENSGSLGIPFDVREKIEELMAMYVANGELSKN